MGISRPQGRLVAGDTVGRYRVLESLGAGGLGEVYRARDGRLDREVALKVFRPSHADEEARDRIRREARTLSQISHPGISTIYDVETANGLDFIVMELVSGETLDDLLERGPLDEDIARGYAAQIADALAAAHELGIIHRDLKPGNVMVDARDRIKLLDFGLALHCPTAAVDSETTADNVTGTIAGTLPYMAPEQLLGRSVDERADLYALGVLLYEMLSGRRPFTAEPATALINDILNAPAPPLTQVGGAKGSRGGPPISEEISALVFSLIEKDPERRPPSASVAAAALRQAPSVPAARAGGAGSARDARSGVAAVGRIASVAVLPLVNMTGAPDQEFFADGMTEALIATLAQVSALRVVSRTSVMQYKNARVSLPEIARALDVDAVMEGSVARSPDRVRVTAQLIDARSDRHLWARSYEREAHDVLALQSEVARAIADEVQIHVTQEERTRLVNPRRVDPEAYEEYLRGRFYWNRRNERASRRAIECFERSIAKDPNYAPAHSGIADAYVTLATYEYVAPRDAFPRAEAALARALELDDELAEAFVTLGALHTDAHWDWDGAEAAFARALSLDPNSATARHWYADLLSLRGRHEAALAESYRAREIDPLSLIVNTGVGIHLFYAGRYETAIEQQRRTLELDPTFAPAHRNLGGAYEQLGRYDEAIASFEHAHEILPTELSAKSLLAHVHAKAGRPDTARRLLSEIEAESPQRYVAKYSLAAIRVGLGEHEIALDLLEEAYRARDRGMVWLKVSPRLEPLRGHPRYRDLLRKMRLDGD